MLYLIRSHGIGKKSALKVGFTNNKFQRFNTYKTENPFFEVISTREGSLETEKILHLYLTSLGLKENFLDEWFLDCEEVLEAFHDNILDAKKSIWRNRDKLFQKPDLEQDTLTRKIFDNLQGFFGKSIHYEIDKYWLMKKNREALSLIPKSYNFGGNDKRMM